MSTQRSSGERDRRSSVTVAVLTEDPDVSRFEADWERLFAFPGNEPSTSFEWTQATLRHRLVAGDRFFLMAILRDSETLALLPLVVRSTKVFGCPVRVLCPISDTYNTHSDVLSRSRDGATACALLNGLYDLPARWDTFRMSNVLETHELLGHLTGAVRRRPLSGLAQDAYASYFLELPNTYEEYLATRTAKFRSYLKRMERNIAAEAAVTVDNFTAVDEVDGAYEKLLEIERASWKHMHGTAISAVPHQVGFYRDVCHGAAARGRLHLQMMTVGSRPAAYNLGYVRDNTYFYLKTSFVEALKPLGVATCLRARLIRSLIEGGLRFMDFPAEPYEWERHWTDRVRWHKKIMLFRATPLGMGLSIAERLWRRTASQRSVCHFDPRAAGPT